MQWGRDGQYHLPPEEKNKFFEVKREAWDFFTDRLSPL
jgi:hypothetical protein